MKWVKSPEVPKEKGAYWCILNDGLGSKNGAYFNGKKWETYKDRFILEWLNESPTQTQGEQGEGIRQIVQAYMGDIKDEYGFREQLIEELETFTAKQKEQLQALRLSNEQGDKLVIELQGNLDDQKVKMGEMTNMWLGANEENRSSKLSNSKLVEALINIIKAVEFECISYKFPNTVIEAKEAISSFNKPGLKDRNTTDK